MKKHELMIKIIPKFERCIVSHDTGKDFYSPRKVISVLHEDILKLHKDF
ncbi:MAG TPA: hypothetical protein VK469_08665 [Candidatus Kapabacteria bacterium]|nr:hypothetical protein [Candidatus Kapabacteria bacterium]